MRESYEEIMEERERERYRELIDGGKERERKIDRELSVKRWREGESSWAPRWKPCTDCVHAWLVGLPLNISRRLTEKKKKNKSFEIFFLIFELIIWLGRGWFVFDYNRVVRINWLEFEDTFFVSLKRITSNLFRKKTELVCFIFEVKIKITKTSRRVTI